jgi:hypothetical protein
MKLLSQQFQGYSNAQSSTVGWKEICCSKSTTAKNQVISFLRLSVTTGNPEFAFTVFTHINFFNENISTTPRGIGNRSNVIGYRINTSGIIDNPTDSGAVNTSAFGNQWDLVETAFPTIVINTNNIEYRTYSTNNYIGISTMITLSVFSDRIDLITLSCI